MVASMLWGRLAALALLVLTFTSQLHGFLIGTGIADVTGPAGEIIMMGYANLGQDTRGIHTRLFSRSYIFVDEVTQKRVVFSSVDVAFVTQNIKRKVMSMLEGKYGKTYTKHNVALSGTHTHSGPGGFADYVLFQVTSLGYVEENFDAIVQGIFESIVAAHDNLQPGRGFLNAGDLYGANINRSPYAYEQNPAEERARYGADTDVLMTLLKLVGSDGRDLGLINWFAVHPVSMNNTNHLISSDHKGAASLLFESLKNGEETAPGQGPFVAAFASSNLGDVSPATKGAFCNGGRRPGLKCDYQTSTCPNWLGNPSSKLCHGQGPSGKDSKLNTKALASMQFEAALDLFNSASTPLQGAIDYRHAFVDMPNLRVKVNGQEVKLCKPAMGYSFAAGTTDGPGVFLFQQGELTGNPYWDAVRDFIFRPTDEILACHAPKPVFLPTGETNFPHEWQAHIVDIQILRIGNLVILVAPGEFTTMAGRRLREAVKKIFVDAGVLGEDSHVVIAGLSNTYADYITTFEEYQVQRYEGASTIYGPNTLAGFIQEYSRLALAMVQNATVPEGPTPPDFTGRQLSFVRPPGVDTLPEGAKFGGVILDASGEYQAGDAIEVSFWAGNPRHDIKLGTSFMFVEREINGTWHTVRTDGNWDTEFVWEVVSERREPLQSVAHLKWFSETSALPGKYRIRYEGHAKTGETEVIPISGTSSVFTLRSSLHAKPETLSRLNDVIKQAEMNNHHMKM